MRHQDLIRKMTLEEKAAFLGGQGEWDSRALPRVGVPSMIMSDGPHGIRRQAGAGDHLGLNESLPATCFPTAATIAESWDPSLGERLGQALGEEAKAEDVNILLGPGLNIKRSPLCGRNFEYFSEDPYLAGKMAASYVRGINSQGVWSCIKHFALNSQEERRMAMNAVCDERTMREIYLTGFEIAVKEGNAHAIMSSYNEINGTYANENPHLLQDILRKDWGFDGVVITDWGGSNSHTEGVRAGSNLEMPAPGLDSARELVEAVKSGSLPESVLDERVDELLDAVLTLTENAKGHSTEFDQKGHHELAREAAAQSAVLLKNEKKILPLAKGTKVAVIGDFAFEPRYQGAGSSVVNCTQLDTVEKLIPGEKGLSVVGMAHGYSRTGEEDEAKKKEAVELAEKADVVLFFFGLDEMSESEGLDRQHMRLPKVQIDLLEAMAQVNPHIVGVLSAGSSIEMPWEGNCQAILHCYLNGQAGAGATLDLLTGRVNPSGHLAETYPMSLDDTSCRAYYPARERDSQYRESLYVGYRYYETAKKTVRYPFGFGLSYTTFSYDHLKVTDRGVSFDLTNTGERDGAEVAQLYVSLPGAKVFRPELELKGFAKVFLKASETKHVEIPFDAYTFRYWNSAVNGWAVEGGEYEVRIGSSVQDIRLQGSVTVKGDEAPLPYTRESLPDYYSGQITNVPDAEYARLLGRAIPDGNWGKDLDANSAICQMVNAKSGLARFVYKKLDGMKKKSEAAGKPDLNILFIYNMPFRATSKMTGGQVSRRMVEGMVDAVNGHFWGGLGKVIGGYFSNKSANKKYEKELSGKK